MALPCRRGSRDNACERKQPSKREETSYRKVELLNEKRDQLMLVVSDAILRIRAVPQENKRISVCCSIKVAAWRKTKYPMYSSLSFFFQKMHNGKITLFGDFIFH